MVLARPADTALVAKVAALLNRLAGDPDMGIARVIDRATVARLGGATEASFMIAFKTRL